MKRLFVACALWTIPPAAALANPAATAVASQTNVFLGQVFNLDVVAPGARPPEAPDLANLPGLNVTTLVEARATSQANAWLYRYALRATREGELLIPALDVGPARTKPITIHAKKPAATDRMSLVQTPSARSVFVGEPILLTTTWDSAYPFGAIKAVDFHFPILNDRRFQVLEPHRPGLEQSANATGLPVHGTRVLARRKSHNVGAVQHQSLSFDKILIPKKSGTLALAPATLLCAAQEVDKMGNRARRAAFQYPAYFDNTFFDQNVQGDQWTRVFTESAPLEIEVKPLPRGGRPALFNGMVGEFSIQVAAEPTNVRAGDPITLTIEVRSERFQENIFLPPLRYQPNLANRFDIPSDRAPAVHTEHGKTYTQTIRARSADQTQIPPIQLAFFSPASNAYVVAESAPIALRVAPAEELEAYGGGAYQNRLRAAGGGIRAHSGDADVLKTRPAPLLGWTRPWLALALMTLPPLLFGGLMLAELFGEKRHVIHRTAKAARAYKAFRRNARAIHPYNMKSVIYRELDAVLRAYLGDRLHLVPGALSFRDAEARLRDAGADPDTIADLERLFAVCEAYRFTTAFDASANAKQIERDAARVVKALERKLK